MPKINDQYSFGGAIERVARLGLTSLFEEVKLVVSGFVLLVKEENRKNDGTAVRRMMDGRFHARRDTGWKRQRTGGVHWTKCHVVDGTETCIGVRFGFSGRSDVLAVDLIHLRRAITGGLIDAGVLVVPNDELGPYLVGRVPRISAARQHVREASAEDLPVVILGIEHDGRGLALRKEAKRGGRGAKESRRMGLPRSVEALRAQDADGKSLAS